MTADRDFETIFGRTDLLLVVDEWKGGQRFETEPAIFQARGFTNVGRTTLPLYQVLASAGAARWHARGARGVSPFLFNSPAFAQIMGELERADTCLYSYLDRNHAHFSKNGPAAPNWTRIMRDRPQLARIWDVGSSHARALFWFLESLLRCLQPHLGPEIRVRIVVDQQDWLSRRESDLTELMPGLAQIGGRDDAIQAELLAIIDKAAPAVQPYLPFLGLVDSESWAFGRLLSLSMPDGARVHDTFFRRYAAGPVAEDDDVITKEQWDELFERHHGDHDQLRSYWVTLTNWPSSKSVDLNEAIGDLPTHEQAVAELDDGNCCFLRQEAGRWTR